MTTPRWYTALQQAVAQHSNSSRKCLLANPLVVINRLPVFQLATVDDAGKPCVRSLIHRAFLVPSSRPAFPVLVASTDIRTPKVHQIAHADTVELAWWINATLHAKQSFQSNKTLRKPSGVLTTYQGLFFQKTSKKEFKSDLGWHDGKKTL